MVIMIVYDCLWLFMNVEDYLWLLLIILCLFLITLLWYVSVLCINGGFRATFFREMFRKINIIKIKTMNE